MLLAILLMLTSLDDTVVTVSVQKDGTCRITVAGQSFDPLREDDALDRALGALPNGRAVRITGDERVPYRCIGGTIYTLQRNGVAKMGFIAEPRGK